MKRPSFQFYPADWLNEIKLRMATYEEKGFLIDLMCLLHQSEKYGYLTKEMEENLSQLLGKDRRTSTRLIGKVREKFLMKRDFKTGELFSERMVRDEHVRGVRQAAGTLGGNPTLLKQKVKQVHKQKETPSSSTSSSSSTSKRTLSNESVGTPSEKMKSFVCTVKESGAKLQTLVAHVNKMNPYMDETTIRTELKRFTDYWTELSKSGKKQRWEMQKTFEVQRRLSTWFNNIKEIQSKPNII